METRKLALTLSLALVAAPALAGGTNGGGHSGGGGGHASASHSSGGHSSGGSYHSSGAVPRSPGGSFAGGPQSRHPGPGYHGRYYYGGYRGGYYGFGGSFGFYPFFYWGYPYYSYSPYYYGSPYYYDDYSGEGYGGGRAYYNEAQGSLRLLVDPDKTKVYVDGYYAGLVENFDGLFERLYLAAGRHELELRLDGYQTQPFKVYVAPDQTLKIHYTMVKGPGEALKEIVVGDPDMDRFTPQQSSRERYSEDDRDRMSDNEAPPPPSRRYAMRPPRDEGATLRLHVIPEDASVYVDGRFYGTARDTRRLDLEAGHHKIEVVRPGFRTYEKDVDLDQDRTLDLEVTLER